MASVNEILARLNLNKRNLDNLSTSQLETVFLDLKVREISLLCRVSRKFNELCKDESFWRNRVLNNHGIDKKYGSTWRKTAKNMDEINMINLNKRWIDGRTYREILNDAVRNGANVIKGLPEQHLLPYVNNNEEDAAFIIFEVYDEKELQDFADIADKSYTDDELSDILLANSVEINIIYTAVRTYEGVNKHLPGECNTFVHKTLSYEFLREMIDPILYVIQFSSFPRNKLDIPFKK
uniref:F-box-like family protein n=1 Tax=Pithovirus LCPAC403 TaxID=2506596 RepID=A0A481ZC56_9VIRU|nr:MAG: F-box-like family protein [Pithovirus LCPAC403]